jgi:hypothetical protein
MPPRLAALDAYRKAVAILFVALAVVAAARWRRLLPPATTVRLETAAGPLRLAPDKAIPAAQTLAYLAEHSHRGDGLAGAPEAGFFNFVTGLPNPLRQEQIFPGHLDAAAEARAVERLERAGPRFFLLVNQPAPAFGAIAFGRDYAARLWQAVERRYRPAAVFGQVPPDAAIGDPRFFIRVYERGS